MLPAVERNPRKRALQARRGVPGTKVPAWIWVAIAVAALAIVGSLVGDDTPAVDNPVVVVDDPGAGDVDLTLESCDVGEFTVTARVTLTSTASFSLVALGGDVYDEDGVSIGQGIGTVSDVVPGQPYETEVIYSVTDPDRVDTCRVRVDSTFR